MASVSSFAPVAPVTFNSLPAVPPALAHPVAVNTADSTATTDNTPATTASAQSNTPSADNPTSGIYSAVSAANTSTIRGTTLDLTT